MNHPKFHKTEVWTHCNGVHTWEIIGKVCRDDPGYVYRVKRDDDYIDGCIAYGDLDEAMKAAKQDIDRSHG
jgi:hypothetical protein